jgi:uncharacterized ion transporter superfamily protein YfcC
MQKKSNNIRWYQKVSEPMVVLFCIIVLAAILTHIVPAGEFSKNVSAASFHYFDLPCQFGTLLMSEKGEGNGLQKIPRRIYGSSSAVMLSRRCKS